jgi:hypothetical protein
MVREYVMVGDYDLEPVRSVYYYALETLLNVPNVNDAVERELSSFGEGFYQMVVPRLVASETSGFDSLLNFSLMVQRAGQLPVLLYIILRVTSPSFVLGNQVKCLIGRCRRFLWL